MRKIFIISALILSTLFAARAVTREEMEQARALSAKIYLRWANNGSDYLDKINPKSIADLEGQLRDREKENLKAFKTIPVPAGYEQWDKTKLVDYWSKTAMNASGLHEDGVRAGARTQIKSRLSQMNVSAPTAEATPAETPAKDTVTNVPDLEPTEVVQEAEDVSLTDSMAEASDSIEAPVRKNSSSTWIYVVALALLVVAVIVLVVYASRTMNRNNKSDEEPRQKRSPESAPDPSAASRIRVTSGAASPRGNAPEGAEPDDMRIMREKYAETLAARQDEIRMLQRRVTELEGENQNLANRASQLEAECERLRRESVMPESGTAATSAPMGAAPKPGVPAGTRQIFLGRVNANGVFVRADRNLNPGNSIYVLHTTDGFSGTFRVAPDRSVYETAFAHPQDMLGGGCVAMDITNTNGKSAIITEAAGTAIFENNCWKVIRKAKIRYE